MNKAILVLCKKESLYCDEMMQWADKHSDYSLIIHVYNDDLLEEVKAFMHDNIIQDILLIDSNAISKKTLYDLYDLDLTIYDATKNICVSNEISYEYLIKIRNNEKLIMHENNNAIAFLFSDTDKKSAMKNINRLCKVNGLNLINTINSDMILMEDIQGVSFILVPDSSILQKPKGVDLINLISTQNNVDVIAANTGLDLTDYLDVVQSTTDSRKRAMILTKNGLDNDQLNKVIEFGAQRDITEGVGVAFVDTADFINLLNVAHVSYVIIQSKDELEITDMEMSDLIKSINNVGCQLLSMDENEILVLNDQVQQL